MKKLFPVKPAPRRPLRAGRGWSRLLLALLALLPALRVAAQQKPVLFSDPGFSAVLVTTGINSPTTMAFAPASDGRVFICQQDGNLRVVKNGQLLATPFVSVAVDKNGERGLIGVAFDPNFLSNQYVYLYYTLPNGANNRIVRYTASAANPDVADPNSVRTVLDLDPLATATNHNGGAMNFGQDGKLYVAVGENTRRELAQNLDSYMGKMLRINSDGSAPTDNPFYAPGASPQRQRVWSSGLRNPFTFSVEPGTGKIFVNNVGEVSWEEINDASVGARNFGWPTQPGGEGYTANPGQTAPIYAYPHQAGSPDGTGCSITGGTFFSPASTNYPAQYRGKYFFMDYCGKWINFFDPKSASPRDSRQPFAQQVGNGDVVGLTTAPDGNLYYLARNGSALFKLVYTNNSSSAPVITTQPVSQSVVPGTKVDFTVAAAGTAPFSYQWQKNGANISGATGSTYSIASAAAADAGQYRAIVTNSVGTATSSAATLTVTAPNTAPTARILTPAEGTTYAGGTVISFSADATDPEDGALPASAFAWKIEFHHNVHFHPGPSIAAGITSGQFTIPNDGEVADDVFYRLVLTVTDKGGLTSTTYRDVQPRKATIRLATSPAGLGLTLDDQTKSTPLAVVSVEGILRVLGAPSPQTVDGVTYEFVSWSNGGAQRQTIATPATDVTYTATYRATTAPPSGPAVTSLTLFNADTDLPLAGYDPLPGGATLNLATLPTRNLNIRANTSPATVGSVRFAYDGNANYRTENIAPYAIGGDNGQTPSGTPNYNAWTPAVGSHTLTVTPYAQGGGSAGTPLTLTFTVTNDAGTPTPNPGGLRTPENPTGTTAGLDYAYYEGTGWNTLPAFATLTPVKTGTTPSFDLTPRQREDDFAFRYTGYVTVPTDGTYTFSTASDDGSQLFIGSQLVVDNDGLHGAQEKSGQIGLKAGTHALTVTFFERGGDQVLSVSYAGPGLSKQLIPAVALQRSGSASPADPTALRPPENPTGTAPGLDYAYYEGAWNTLPDFKTLNYVKTGTASALDLTPRLRDDEFALRYTGYVTVPTDGQYTFSTASDDGSQLFIGSQLVVDNDGLHGAQEKSGQIGLKAGTHALTVTFFERGGGQVLSVSYAGPGLSKQLIPTAALHRAAATGAQTVTATRAAGAGAALAVQLYPNPAQDEVAISLQSPAAQQAQVEVYDGLGRRVVQSAQPVQAGANTLRLPLDHLAPGVYSVSVRVGTARSVQRLAVTR